MQCPSKTYLLAIGAVAAIGTAAGVAVAHPLGKTRLMRGSSNDWSSSSQDDLGQLKTTKASMSTQGFKISKGAAKDDASNKSKTGCPRG